MPRARLCLRAGEAVQYLANRASIISSPTIEITQAAVRAYFTPPR